LQCSQIFPILQDITRYCHLEWMPLRWALFKLVSASDPNSIYSSTFRYIEHHWANFVRTFDVFYLFSCTSKNEEFRFPSFLKCLWGKSHILYKQTSTIRICHETQASVQPCRNHVVEAQSRNSLACKLLALDICLTVVAAFHTYWFRLVELQTIVPAYQACWVGSTDAMPNGYANSWQHSKAQATFMRFHLLSTGTSWWFWFAILDISLRH
jgi:hypothetical protein